MSTICAISTPRGTGGIAVIRVSGKDAIRITDSIFSGRHPLQDARGYSAHYGTIADLDDVIVTVFRAPHSFTGEDVVEIACHGSLYIQQELLLRLINAGCRLAEAGEFTKRAFMNGKMDLSEAEAVADLIAAESRAAHNIALNQMRGGIRQELKTLRERLLHFTSLVELELDFADHEELEFADRTELSRLAAEVESHILRLLNTFHTGNALKNGIPVAIIGPTNVGKSTLLNALAGENRAIVSAVHGTTRDTIEDTVNINGVTFRFIDTAGLRHTDNEIEVIGIQRTIEAAAKASVILLVSDARQAEEALPENIDLNGKTVIHVRNKADLVPDSDRRTYDTDTVFISARQGDLSNLRDLLFRCLPANAGTSDTVISNIRHYEALQKAADAIKRVSAGIKDSISGEFLSMDLQDCLTALGEITGEITSTEVLENIFKHFCIGK